MNMKSNIHQLLCQSFDLLSTSTDPFIIHSSLSNFKPHLHSTSAFTSQRTHSLHFLISFAPLRERNLPLRRLSDLQFYLLLYHIFLHAQIIDDKILPVLGVFAHVVVEDGLDVFVILDDHRVQPDVAAYEAFKLLR